MKAQGMYVCRTLSFEGKLPFLQICLARIMQLIQQHGCEAVRRCADCLWLGKRLLDKRRPVHRGQAESLSLHLACKCPASWLAC